MPWSVQPMSEIRLAFVHQVLTLHKPVANCTPRRSSACNPNNLLDITNIFVTLIR